MSGHLGAFLREFLRNPLHTGGVVPSSRELAAQVVIPIPETGKPMVVELGPGTGALTGAIQDRLDGRGHHLAVELNQRFAELITEKFPGVDVVHENASKLPELVRSRGYEHADVIISGLPWAAFPATVQNTLLEAVTGALAPDGVFTTFAYLHALGLPPARRFRARLGEVFDEVVVGRTVWSNLPPALVYFARRPRVAQLNRQ
ncbi:MAG: class I SAM-dependent methyltransferase [Micromonosporaceae bacterium]